MTDTKKDGRLCQTVDQHMQERSEGGYWASETEGKGSDPHVFNGRIRKHSLDVFLSQEGKSGHQYGNKAKPHHDVAGMVRMRGAVDK